MLWYGVVVVVVVAVLAVVVVVVARPKAVVLVAVLAAVVVVVVVAVLAVVVVVMRWPQGRHPRHAAKTASPPPAQPRAAARAPGTPPEPLRKEPRSPCHEPLPSPADFPCERSLQRRLSPSPRTCVLRGTDKPRATRNAIINTISPLRRRALKERCHSRTLAWAAVRSPAPVESKERCKELIQLLRKKNKSSTTRSVWNSA